MSIFSTVCKGILWAADPSASVRRNTGCTNSRSIPSVAQFGQLYQDTLCRIQKYCKYHKGRGTISTVFGTYAVDNSDLDSALQNAITIGDKAAIGILNRMKRLSTNERVNLVRATE